MRSYRYVAGVDATVETSAGALLIDPSGAEPDRVRQWVLGRGAGVVWVRLRQEDVRAVVSPAVAGVSVAAGSATEIAALATVLAEAEEGIGLPVGAIGVMPRLETAAAVLQAAEIARAPRVVRLHLADARLAEQLRADPDDASALLTARSMVVLASAAAGLAPPIADAGPAGDDGESSGRILRRLGFRGRICLDEAQVRIADAMFADA